MANKIAKKLRPSHSDEWYDLPSEKGSGSKNSGPSEMNQLVNLFENNNSKLTLSEKKFDDLSSKMTRSYDSLKSEIDFVKNNTKRERESSEKMKRFEDLSRDNLFDSCRSGVDKLLQVGVLDQADSGREDGEISDEEEFIQ